MDAMLLDLLKENEAALLPLVKKAYELGYREALAARPEPAPAPAPVTIPALAAVSPAPLFTPPVEPDEPEEDAAPADEAEGEDDGDDGTRPVPANITVGGLVKKIKRYFGLERFDLEVRIVDPRSKRHLMRDVRLSRYVAKE